MHLYLVECGVYSHFFVDKYVHNRGGVSVLVLLVYATEASDAHFLHPF